MVLFTLFVYNINDYSLDLMYFALCLMLICLLYTWDILTKFTKMSTPLGWQQNLDKKIRDKIRKNAYKLKSNYHTEAFLQQFTSCLTYIYVYQQITRSY